MEPNTLDYTLGRIAGRLDSIDQNVETMKNDLRAVNERITDDNRAYNERITDVEAKVGRLNWVMGGLAALGMLIISTATDWVRSKLGI